MDGAVKQPENKGNSNNKDNKITFFLFIIFSIENTSPLIVVCSL